MRLSRYNLSYILQLIQRPLRKTEKREPLLCKGSQSLV